MERLIIDNKIHTDFLLTKQQVRIKHLGAIPRSYVIYWDRLVISLFFSVLLIFNQLKEGMGCYILF